MKLSIVVSLLLISTCLQAQFRSRTDSNSSMVPAHRPMNKSFYVGEGKNIVVASTSPGLTAIEKEIASLEDREAEALKKRDYVALTGFWAKDFSTDDASTDQIVSSNNSLPYYTVLSRIIESVSATDSTAFTNGREQFQILANASKKDLQERKFFHIWSIKNGTWKLTSKVHIKE